MNFKRMKYFALSFLLLSGCSSMTQMVKPDEKIANNDSLVLGRLVIQNPNNIALIMYFKNINTGKSYAIKKWNHIPLFGPKDEDGTGYFAINLPPGRYWCYKLVQQGFWEGVRNIDLYFNVPTASTVYIGSLIYDVSNMKNMLYLVATMKISISVADEQDDAIYYFKDFNYNIGTNIVKNLMSKDL